MKILSIETSCDETAAAIIEMKDGIPLLLANVVSSQADAHAKFGGVVPQLAARMHIENITPVLDATLAEAKLIKDDIDLIAVTEGPGLIPALLIGVSAAKTLSLLWKKPLMGIHHIEGHIYANFISDKMSVISNFQFPISKQTQNSEIKELKIPARPAGGDSKFKNKNSKFPLVALVVSGGHTQLVLMRDHFQYEILGETEDDAVGEAFDKVARMLGLPYPGGPIVAKRADNFRMQNAECRFKSTKLNSPQSAICNQKSAISFPRPMINSDNYNFSFSGLKTSVLYFLKKNEDRVGEENFIDEVCYEFQEAVVDVLVEKSKQAIEEFQPKTFVIAGGVSANVRLRNQLRTMIAEEFPETIFSMPEFTHSLDNAAMIGAAAAFRYERMTEEQKTALNENWKTLEASANLTLSNL
jgi:N6-L-threonylcarbamoyladenine synthase